ncbi:Protein BYPASS-related [Quillaja saponaria]|uniref:Protein BYPASS-related n=1 Tax=Quillaja saponaria TaxID=32244 RepID=A0AAD7Q634_QUISA|nr:Protein BYPASS-related [Quillaja saponaria]
MKNNTMKEPSAILKGLSLRWILASPAAVAPLPIRSRFDQQLTAELDTLRSQGSNTNKLPESTKSAIWLIQALDASINTQKLALDSIINVVHYQGASDRKVADEYLEINIGMLDSCNYLVEKIELVKSYVKSVRVLTHLLGHGSSVVELSAMALSRALNVLESCHGLEKQCGKIDKQFCRFLELALSFNSKRQLPTTRRKKQSQPMVSSWSNLLEELQNGAVKGSSMLSELQQTITAAEDLEDKMKCKKKQKKVIVVASGVEELKRNCGELEGGIEVIEGKLKELYKHLIDIRMALLGILSHGIVIRILEETWSNSILCTK